MYDAHRSTLGNAGIGAETVKAIAAHNPKVLFLCARSPSKADAFITELRQMHPTTTTKAVTLDLASFDSIKSAAKEINASCDQIDILILNAGVSALAPAVTKDGYEIQVGTNHIGHALFTQLLMPKVLVAATTPGADTRIVVVSSRASLSPGLSKGIPLDELKTDMANAGMLKKYAYSKLANAYFAQSLALQYPSVTVTAPHPGVVFTEIWGKVTAVPSFVSNILSSIVRTFALTAEQGAQNSLWCAFGAGVESGKYYEPIGKEVANAGIHKNPAYRDALWEWTNKELAAHGAPGWP